jgi:flagellar biosynthesis protein FlhF
MKIKSYFARTVEGAMATARQELGPDAMLVNSRKTSLETRHLGEYEVVFATVAPGAEAVAAAATLPVESNSSSAQASSAQPFAAQPFGERLATEVADLKKELESMRRAITRSAFAPAQWVGVAPDLSDAYAMLTASEVAPDIAREIVQSAGSRLSGPRLSPRPGSPLPINPAAFQQALLEELQSRFQVAPTLGTGPGQPRIVALVGPPGCGKTTTLVKLAVNYGLAARRPVLLLSMDTQRVGAAEQLRSYAAILGVAFQVLETTNALAQAIEENRGKELIFIDTPGFALGDLQDSTSLAHFLSTRPDIDTHLVLSASMKSADLTRMVDAFEILRPQHLLFTKLDETGSFGPIFSEAARTRKPLSFFTTGQRIPEDLEAATQARLVELIMTGQSRKLAAA